MLLTLLACHNPPAITGPTTRLVRVVDDVPLRADIYHPAEVEGAPVALLVHGGAFVEGARDDESTVGWAHRAAEAGFVAVAVDYRLLADLPDDAPGYPAPLLDVACAAGWATEVLEDVGPGRVAVGTSAGGTLATLTALGAAPEDPSCPWETPRFDGVVALYAVHDWAALADTRALYASEQALLGSDCADEADRVGICAEASSARAVASGAPPFFLAASADDGAVPASQSALMAEALREAGVAVEHRELTEAGHGFSTRASHPEVGPLLDEIVDWMGAAADP
ncbi:MAG: alpha/beta hydrolase [Alphaproteobacteria bacterium]|nr:alpha/beta hydrolase [Alphaproteobacteria bacterium]